MIPGLCVGKNIITQIRHIRIWLSRLDTPKSPLGPPEQVVPHPFVQFFNSNTHCEIISKKKEVENIPSTYSRI